MKLSARTILAKSLGDLRCAWPQLIAADLVARVLTLALLTPLCGLLLKLFLATTPTGVVADTAIVDFLLHPIGLATLIICGSFSLAVWFVETSQLMVIAFGCSEDRRVRVLEALKYTGKRASALVHLALLVVVRLLLVALPFVAAIGATYWFLLRRYDIGYYLAERPPEFRTAIAIAGLLLTVMGLLVIIRVAGWLLALPMVLFDGLGGRDALRASEQATAPQRWRLVVWLAAWLVVPVLVSSLVNLVAGGLADAFIPRDGSHMAFVIAWLSGLLVVSGLAHFVILVGTTILFPLVVVRLYRSLAGPGALGIKVAKTGPPGPGTFWKIPGKAILLTGVAALVLVAGGAYRFARTVDWQDHAQIIAHRGGSAAAPENTLAAFRQGIADGADWLELDVQENADGDVVVVHDRDFMRVARRETHVFQITGSELRDLDVGSFFAPAFADQRVPTLRDVLEQVKGRAGLFIELKYYGHDQALERKVVDLVEAAGMTSRTVIMSLEYDGIRKTAEMRPRWTYGLLNAVAIGDLTRLQVDFLALAAKGATYSTIRRAHRRGLKVYAWTINDPIQMWVMMSRGVDGIITDRVALARQVMDLRARVTPLGRFVIWMAGEAGLLHGKEWSSSKDDA